MTLAGTGHRPHKLGGYADNPTQKWVKDQIRAALVASTPDLIISGMQAVGFVWIMMCWNTTVTFGDSDV